MLKGKPASMFTMKTHKVKEKKKVECHICESTFANNRNLLSHLKTQHGLARNKKRLSSCERCFNMKLLFSSGNKAAMSTLNIPPFTKQGVCVRCDQISKMLAKV